MMTKLIGVRCKCDVCGAVADLAKIDGVVFDPPGWTRRGQRGLCDACQQGAVMAPREVSPEIVAARGADVAEDVDASVVECPYCHAQPTQGCTRARSRTRAGDDGPPDALFFHAERVAKARDHAATCHYER